MAEFDTALLANTMDYIDDTPPYTWYMGGEIKSQTPSLGPTVGIAMTAKIDTSTPGGEADMEHYFNQLERMQGIDLPKVWVVEAVGSRPDHECVIGDGMAKTLYSCGCLGVVTNGYGRDISGCETVPFAVHARGTIAHHEPMRFPEVDGLVSVGGITVEPDAVIHADREGVIKIPAHIAETLIERAPAMRTVEYEAHVLLRRSENNPRATQERIADLLAKHGFEKGEKGASSSSR